MRRIENEPGRTPLLVLRSVGDHGGGPSRRDLDDLTALAARLREHGIDLVHSNPEACIAEARDSRSHGDHAFPTCAGDLRHATTGCYTSLALVKRRHRELENLLYGVEEMASCAALRLLGHGMEVASRLRASLLFHCAARFPPVPDGTIPIDAYNPHAHPVRGNDGTVNLTAFTVATYRLRRRSIIETDLCEQPLRGSVADP